MKALVLCAGKGIRLHPLTIETPKPLLKITQDYTILDFILSALKKHDIKKIIVNNSGDNTKIIDHCYHLKKTELPEITWFNEPELSGTAGALYKSKWFFDEEDNFFVHYGDVVSRIDYSAMLEWHKEKKSICTIALHFGESNSQVEIDRGGNIINYVERPSTIKKSFVNSGIYIFNKKIFDILTIDMFDIPKDLFPVLLDKRVKFCGFLNLNYRIAVDSIERYEKLKIDMGKTEKIDIYKKGW